MNGKKKLMVEALKQQLGVVTAACKAVEISRKTHYQWIKTDPEYAEAMENLPDFVLDFAENALFKLMQEGNVASILFYLKCKGKHRGYIERPEQQINILKQDTNIQLNPEEVKRIVSALDDR